MAVDGVSAEFRPGTLTAIVGPNGAGKTTYFNLISGQLPASAGSVRLFGEDPHETLRRHLWVSPHFEEDKRAVADLLGVDRILMGTDWPHAEGLVQPADYRTELERDGFTEVEVDTIMRRNTAELLRL